MERRTHRRFTLAALLHELNASEEVEAGDAEALADAVTRAAQRLSDGDDARRAALTEFAARLHDSGFWPVPNESGLDEVVTQIRSDALSEHDVARLASNVTGRALSPTGRQRYADDERVGLHLDERDWPYALIVVLEHEVPEGERPSRLVVQDRDGTHVLDLREGDAVVLAGRGTLHGWEPMTAGEVRRAVHIGLSRTP